jgi:hypothetical protein
LFIIFAVSIICSFVYLVPPMPKITVADIFIPFGTLFSDFIISLLFTPFVIFFKIISLPVSIP